MLITVIATVPVGRWRPTVNKLLLVSQRFQ